MKEMKQWLELERYNRLQKRVGLALLVLTMALATFIIYFIFFRTTPCSDSTCFVMALQDCKHVSWIKDDERASWLYTIEGNSVSESCQVGVKLLTVKQGTIDAEKLQGAEMTCDMKKGDTQFPENNIASCHGLLKEEMQDLIIQRMHNYLLENVGQITQKFSGI